MVKKIVKIILETDIYPSNEVLQKTTEDFLSDEHKDFIKKFKKDKWIAYYENIFYPNVSLN